MAVYVDTSAWIALHEPRERDHAAAKEALAQLGRGGELLITGWHTVIEFADGLVRHYDQERAALVVGRMLASPRLRLEPSEAHMARAIEILTDPTGWNVDLSDCLSFAVMEHLGIRNVFTYDDDFGKPGFVLVQ